MHSYFGLYWFFAFFALLVFGAFLFARKPKAHLTKDNDVPETKLPLPIPKITHKKEDPKKEDPKLEVNYDDPRIVILTPKGQADWKYLEDNGRDCFAFGDFKIYSNGDIYLGTIDTAVNNKMAYNQLIQKLAIETIKNNYKIPDSVYYKEPAKPNKEKKKANT